MNSSIAWSRSLGLMTGDGQNNHLDTLEGRYWLQQEWRALARSLATSGTERTSAVRDALAFRLTRRALFPGAAENERLEEIREGLAQYTATVTTAASPRDTAQSAIQQLAEFAKRESLVREFRICVGNRIRDSFGCLVSGLDQTRERTRGFGRTVEDRGWHCTGRAQFAGSGGAGRPELWRRGAENRGGES